MGRPPSPPRPAPESPFADVDALILAGDCARALCALRAHPAAAARPAEARERLRRVRARLAAEKALAPARRRRRACAWETPEEGQKRLIVNATTRCNQKCVYCFELHVHFTKPDSTYEEIDALLVRARGEGFTQVCFVGGEITLVRWLPRAIRRIRELGMGAGIVTNGTALSSRRLCEALVGAGIGWIELSFLSHVPDEDYRVGLLREGLDRRLRALENLSALRRGRAGSFGWGVNVVLTAVNRASLLGTMRALAKFRPDQIKLKGLDFNDNVVDASIVSRYSDLRRPVDDALRYLEARRIPLALEFVPLCFVRPRYWLSQPPRDQSAGVGFTYGSRPGEFDFGTFRGREHGLVKACGACALYDHCYLPRARYVALHGEAEFRPPPGAILRDPPLGRAPGEKL